jgi:hypothetical protein
MTLRPEESVCLADPLARITVTVPVMPGGASALATHKINGDLQCVNEIRHRRIGRRGTAILIQPTAC